MFLEPVREQHLQPHKATNSANLDAIVSIESSIVLKPLRDPSNGLTNVAKVIKSGVMYYGNK